jgi:phosphomannomutase
VPSPAPARSASTPASRRCATRRPSRCSTVRGPRAPAARAVRTAGRCSTASSRTCCRLRRPHDASARAARRRRHRQRDGRARGARGVRRIPQIELEVMYGELDGTFPNHPADPLQPGEPARPAGARRGRRVRPRPRVRRRRRPRVRGRRGGNGLSGSTTTALLAARAACAPGAPPSSTTSSVRGRCPRPSAEHGGVPVRTKVGHSYIKQTDGRDRRGVRRRALGALLLRAQLPRRQRADRLGARDRGAEPQRAGVVGAPQALRALCRERRDQHPGRRHGRRDRADVSAAFADREQDRLDGLTVECGSWWFNLRPSNTEPLLRLNLEAADRDECDTKVADLLALITGA